MNLAGGNFLLLVGSRGVETHLGMNIGTRGLVGGEGMRMDTFLACGVASFSSVKVQRHSRQSERDLFSESQ